MAKRRKYLVLFIMVLLFLVPFLWSSQNLYNLGGDDSRLYFYSPIDWLKNIAFCSWFGYFGSFHSQQAYLPLNIFSLVLKHLFPFLNLQKMLYGLILSFGFLTIFLILKEFLKTKDRASYYAAILGGLTYIFSPLIYCTQWSYPMASLIGIIGYPLLFFFFLRAIREQRIKYLAIGVLVSLVFSVTLSAIGLPWLAAFLVGISLFYLLYIFFFPGQLNLVIKYGLIYIFFIILINSLWFLPESFSLFQRSQLSAISALSAFGREMGVHTVKTVAPSMNIFDTLLNLLSRGLIYNWNWPHVKIVGYIYGLVPLNIFLPLIIFLPLLLRKKEEDIPIFKFWFALAIPTLLLAYFQTVNIWKIGINFFNLLMKYLPGWRMLQNFFHKVPITYVFFYSLSLGVSLYIISKRISRPIIQKGVFLIVLLVIIWPALPFIRGAVNNLHLRPDIEATMNLELPSYYSEALDTMRRLEEGKALTLPLTFASWSFFADKRNNGLYLGLSPISVFTGRNDFNGAFAFDEGKKFIPGLTSLIKEAMQNRDYEFLGKIFGLLNLRYIFYSSEIYEDKTVGRAIKPYLWGDKDFQTKDNIERLVEEISNKRIGKFGPISIYELSDEYYYPTIYATNKTILCNRETFVPLTLRHIKYLGEKPVFLFNQQIEDNPEFLPAPRLRQAGKAQSQKKRPEVEFRKVNPMRYVVRTKASEPFWLVFSEAYHPQWRAYVKSVNRKNCFEWSALVSVWRDRGKRVELKEHYLVNGYANAWYVPVGQFPPKADQPQVEASLPVSQLTNVQTKQATSDERQTTSEMEIVLEFIPQRLFEVGVLISGLTLLGCVGYLVGTGVRRKKRGAESKEERAGGQVGK